MHSNDTPSPESIKDDDDFKLDGPIKRNLHILIPIILGFVVAPPLTHLMSTYRAIVLSQNGSELLVMKKDRPPETIEEISARPGEMICKTSGAWNIEKCATKAEDAPLEKLYVRYNRSFIGKIVGSNPPVVPGGASSAVVLLEDKEKIEVELWAQHLAGAKVGLGLKKEGESWEPKLVPDPFSGNIQLQAPEEKNTKVDEKNL